MQMSWSHRSALHAALIVVAVLLSPTPAIAQSSSANYQVPRQSIDGGGTRASSTSYAVACTVGQPDAGPAMTGAGYELRGGFQQAAAASALPDALFANSFE